jgi:TrmH RNA methyltransferase
MNGRDRPKRRGAPTLPAGSDRARRGERPVPRSPRPDSLTPEFHDVDKICGLSAVAAVFRRDPARVLRLYYSDRMKGSAGGFCATLAAQRRPYRMVSEPELERVGGTVLHGGIVAAATPRAVPQLTPDDLARWSAAGEALVILDGIGNPHNLGAIARTLAFFGLPRMVLSDHSAQAGLSDAAYRVAEGGLEYLDIYSATRLPELLKAMRPLYRVVATAAEHGADVGMLSSPGKPICLLLGNEEHGLLKATLRACAHTVTIAGAGQVQSLNVSATAAILVAAIAAGKGRR